MRFAGLVIASLAIGYASPGLAAKVCVEDVGGVCLKYEERSDPIQRRVSPEETAERRLGLSRAERRDVQTGLRDAGFYNGSIDGALGPQSRRAIARWQGSRGEPGSGYLTAAQFAFLRESARRPAPVEEPTAAIAAPEPEPTPAPEPAVAPQPAPEPKVVEEAPHPQPGRVYREERNSIQGSHVVMEVERVDASNVKITLTVKADRTMRKSCIAPIAGPVNCYLRQQSWNMIYVSGTLPRLSASESEVRLRTPFRIDKEIFNFW